MGSLSSPLVLVLAGSLAAAGAAIAGSHRGRIPSLRANLLVAIASFWASFALLSLAERAAQPSRSVLMFAGFIALFTGARRAGRWWESH